MFTGFVSCGQIQPPKILSPKEKIRIIPYRDILIDKTEKPDTISDLNSFHEQDSIWIIGAGNGIYIINNNTLALKKYFKFDIKSHSTLFDGQDSIVGFNFVDITTNKDNSKILIHTSNGILFQLKTKDFKIDWLAKIINRFETITYSDNSKLIAIGLAPY